MLLLKAQESVFPKTSDQTGCASFVLRIQFQNCIMSMVLEERNLMPSPHAVLSVWMHPGKALFALLRKHTLDIYICFPSWTKTVSPDRTFCLCAMVPIQIMPQLGKSLAMEQTEQGPWPHACHGKVIEPLSPTTLPTSNQLQKQANVCVCVRNSESTPGGKEWGLRGGHLVCLHS